MPTWDWERYLYIDEKRSLSSDVPPELLQAIGRVVVDWVHAEWLVQGAAASFFGMDHDLARVVLPRVKMKELTQALVAVADERDPTKETSKRLKKLIEDLLEQEQKRNWTVHDRWWKALDEQGKLRVDRVKKALTSQASRTVKVDDLVERAFKISKAANCLATAIIEASRALPSKSH